MHWYVNYPESETFFSAMYNEDFSYPAHLHSCMEVTFCIGGELEVTLDGQCRKVCDGEGILIPHNVVHSYHTAEHSAYCTILFSRDVLPDFAALFTRRRPGKYVFAFDGRLREHLSDFYRSQRTVYGLKALLYQAAELFLKDNAFVASEKTDDDLTKRIIFCLQDNMAGELSLQDMADHLGYSYSYVSKRIRQIFGVSFSTLLAQYRVANAKSLLNTGNYTVSQAALASGFGSIRTFNRVFSQVTGQTPSGYLSSPYRSEVLDLNKKRGSE